MPPLIRHCENAANPVFTSKAQVLENLQAHVHQATILPSYVFKVKDWQTKTPWHLQQIQHQFQNQRVIVRSSALGEDTHHESLAGRYHSELNVEVASKLGLTQAIEKVIASYTGNPQDEVLVQPMLEEISISGVMTTHTLSDGAPYYVINYDDESGKTDTITGGIGANKTVLVHHQTNLTMVQSERLQKWITLLQELEGLFPETPLDVEFAQTQQGQLYLLQVRPIAAQKQWNTAVASRVSQAQEHIETFIKQQSTPRGNLLGAQTFLGEMTDWNPAEMIGTSPRPLAVSLYRQLITDRIWRKARAWMGYRHPEGEALMMIVGGRPYVDIRNSFNSFLPAGLPDAIGEKLVNAWLNRLGEHPELHDKIEFEVAQTALHFNLEAQWNQWYSHVLTKEEEYTFKKALTQLTLQCLDLSLDGSLHQALTQIRTLERRQEQEPLETLLKNLQPSEVLYTVRRLVQDCQLLGTFPFAIIARHAFIAENLLRSAVDRGGLSVERLQSFKSSLCTITTEMSLDLQRVVENTFSQQEFLSRYGHLRPGTYDILSLRYDQRPDLFEGHLALPRTHVSRHLFTLTLEESDTLDALLKEVGLGHFTSFALMDYCRTAIVGREYAKFIFSRSISTVLELLAHWGESVGLSREEISFTPLDRLLDTLTQPLMDNAQDYYRSLAEEGRNQLEVTRSLRLSYLIQGVPDVYVVPLHRSAPNFTTAQIIEGEPVFLGQHSQGEGLCLAGKIVCIENADPGYDWIFTRGIAGLITQFGGANSHMAIRCAEFGLPAAIGCGEQTFERLVRSPRLELNCADKIVRPIYG